MAHAGLHGNDFPILAQILVETETLFAGQQRAAGLAKQTGRDADVVQCSRQLRAIAQQPEIGSASFLRRQRSANCAASTCSCAIMLSWMLSLKRSPRLCSSRRRASDGSTAKWARWRSDEGIVYRSPAAALPRTPHPEGPVPERCR